uniref:PKD/Chitinase domain-containing protein n=1 Tax=Neogobius melanostomus TaxID=47308 RepID=A0A8C6TBF3_9GOBI
ELQNIQNAAARVLTRTRKYDHISPVLRSLHWLPSLSLGLWPLLSAPRPRSCGSRRGSYTLTLPNSSVVLQGSATNTDPETVRYLWTRDAQSPAAGEVLFGSETRSSLVLVNLVEGSYLFHLRVMDAEGRSATASATVQVLPGNAKLLRLLVSQRDTVVNQLSALLHVPRPRSDCEDSTDTPDSGTLTRRPHVLFVVMQSKTRCRLRVCVRTVCQLQCSGRGQCDPVSRLCLCDPFWTENLFRTYLGDGQSNCEWRVLYVILSGFILVILILSAVWTFMCCCRRKRQSKVRRKTRYTILDNVDEQERVELRPKFSLKHRSTEHNSSLMMSESELSDQDFRDPPLRNEPGGSVLAGVASSFLIKTIYF